MSTTLRLGLTGGIGSGKSTVATLLAKQGATHLDADLIARNCTAADGAAIPAIVESFGSQLIGADGGLDRDAMRALAFKDPNARMKLEAIVHPLVGAAIERESEMAVSQGSKCLVFDIPLLVESGRWRGRLDKVLVVDCETETQIQRVMQRNGMGRADVERIVAAQAGRIQRLRSADTVLLNDGISLSELATEVQQLSLQFGL